MIHLRQTQMKFINMYMNVVEYLQSKRTRNLCIIQSKNENIQSHGQARNEIVKEGEMECFNIII